ncbi:MAG TPA: GDP-mannose 4,6-dehydratase, partial [bacterium]|nr:GDP-mannose 4,6-dehydratase [bacterium]
MTTLVTGASGFVGQHVRHNMEAVPLELGGRRVDLREPDRVLEAVRRIRPGRVLHLAAQSHVPTSFADPEGTFEINFWGTLNLLRGLKATGFRGTMLYVGSGDAYGLVPAQALPIREEQPLRPRNPYAVSKVAAEALCYQWSQTEGLRVVMARPFNHVGPGQRPDFVVAQLAR